MLLRFKAARHDGEIAAYAFYQSFLPGKFASLEWRGQRGIGPIRAAMLVALIQTPHRFRAKRQLWTYSGLGLETQDSAQYRVVEGQLKRSKKSVTLRGLN